MKRLKKIKFLSAYSACKISIKNAAVRFQTNGYDCGPCQANILYDLYVNEGIKDMKTTGSNNWDRDKARTYIEDQAEVICE